MCIVCMLAICVVYNFNVICYMYAGLYRSKEKRLQPSTEQGCTKLKLTKVVRLCHTCYLEGLGLSSVVATLKLMLGPQ